MSEPSNAPELKQRVLVVDDNFDAATTLSVLLQTKGFITRTAHDGKQAVSAVASFNPNIILLDIALPGMNGVECCQTIREDFPNSKIFIVAITGWQEENISSACFDSFLTKPVDFNTLVDLLNSR